MLRLAEGGKKSIFTHKTKSQYTGIKRKVKLHCTTEVIVVCLSYYVLEEVRVPAFGISRNGLQAIIAFPSGYKQ